MPCGSREIRGTRNNLESFRIGSFSEQAINSLAFQKIKAAEFKKVCLAKRKTWISMRLLNMCVGGH